MPKTISARGMVRKLAYQNNSLSGRRHPIRYQPCSSIFSSFTIRSFQSIRSSRLSCSMRFRMHALHHSSASWCSRSHRPMYSFAIAICISNILHYIRVLSFMHEGCNLSSLLSCQPAPDLRDRDRVAVSVVLERLGLVFFDGHNYASMV